MKFQKVNHLIRLYVCQKIRKSEEASFSHTENITSYTRDRYQSGNSAVVPDGSDERSIIDRIQSEPEFTRLIRME